MSIKIPTTPQMRRFNAALESADSITNYRFDQCEPGRLISSLLYNFSYAAAVELCRAYEAQYPVDNNPTGD